MTIVFADYILTCDENFTLIEKGAICFEKTIIDIDTQEAFLGKYPDATIIHTDPHTVLMPGLINPHVHLEFSANQSTLTYGDFMPWLGSVIQYREELLEAAKGDIISRAIEEMVHSGTTTFGAISSFGMDLEACVKSPARTIFFNEILGSRPDAVDILFEDFRHRLHCAEDARSSRFIPAISIHSPYSTHPILARNALDMARKEKYVVSTHFMESQAERNWLDNAEGDFADFFAGFAPGARPFCTPLEYLDLFYGCSTLFTHTVQATQNEREIIAKMQGTITHCPRSNRLLGTGLMDLQATIASGINLTLGTDGLSSNTSLSLWEELRVALMSHSDIPLQSLAQTLLYSVTRNGAKALRLNTGELSRGKEADIIALTLKEAPKSLAQLPLHLILQASTPNHIFIEGDRI